jgi:hypothetical protein
MTHSAVICRWCRDDGAELLLLLPAYFGHATSFFPQPVLLCC